ncbi:hypothetical protein AB3N59_17150 [Leptospira sp. WS92.C1]
MFEFSGIVYILHLGILNSTYKIGLNDQIPSKKIETIEKCPQLSLSLIHSLAKIDYLFQFLTGRGLNTGG